MIDPLQLRCLVALVEEASVSRAAQRLSMSQPALSHALARARKRFGDPLLVRVGTQMVPTPRAREIAQEGAELLRRLERLAAPRVAFAAEHAHDAFVLSAPENVEHLLAPVLQRTLAAQAPHARLWIRPPDPRQAERQLETGEIDLRLGWAGDPAPSTRSRQLFTDRFVCVTRSDHPATRTPLDLATYIRLGHVRAQVSMPSTASRHIDAALRRLGAAANVTLVLPSYLTIAHVLAGSDLVATLPRGIASSLAKGLPLALMEPPLKIPPARAAMYWHERVQRDARHSWLRELVTRAAAEVAVQLEA